MLEEASAATLEWLFSALPGRMGRLPVGQHRLAPRSQEIQKGNQYRQSRHEARELEQYRLIQMEGSLHKYRANQNDRGGDAKNFQSIGSHARSVGKTYVTAHRTEGSVTLPTAGSCRIVHAMSSPRGGRRAVAMRAASRKAAEVLLSAYPKPACSEMWPIKYGAAALTTRPML